MAHQFTKEHLILHAVWRKAFNDGQLTIPVKSASDATRLRFSLYNAVRPVREGKVVAPDLLQAVQECSVRIEGLSVVVQLKARPPAGSSRMLGSDRRAFGCGAAES